MLNIVFRRHFGFVKCRGLGVKGVGRGRGRERKDAGRRIFFLLPLPLLCLTPTSLVASFDSPQASAV